MNFFFRFLQKVSRFSLKLIPINYKKNHKFQNKNQVTNSSIALSLLKDKMNPEYIFDIGCGHGEWFLKCNEFFPHAKYLLFDGNKLNDNKLSLLKKKYSNFSYKICLLSDSVKKLNFFNMGYGSSVYEEKQIFLEGLRILYHQLLKMNLLI